MKLLGERMADLLPCPFCGVRLDWHDEDGGFAVHPLNGCRESGHQLEDAWEQDAWNRRAAPEAPSDAAARGAQSLGWILDELRNGEATDHDIARRLVDAEPDIRAALAALRPDGER
jgi:hypothetical protein